MIGAIIGDVVGSIYENFNVKKKDFKMFSVFSMFTDDTVLNIATADCILNNGNFAEYYRKYCLKNIFRGYGPRFIKWALLHQKTAYNSMGNGSAMRVIPVGYVCNSVEEVMELAKRSAEVTHNHPEGIKGAQATAVVVYLCRTGSSKEEVKKYIEDMFGYDLSMTYEELKKTYKGGLVCQTTVPQAIISFLYSDDFEDAIRNAIYLGGDSDTIACITGGIAEAYYKVIPEYMLNGTIKRLKPEFVNVVELFKTKYM